MEKKARQVKRMSIALQETENLLLDLKLDPPCFAVGGSPRDKILNRDYADLDIAVEEKGGAKKLAARLHRLFPKETSRPFKVGRLYPIWKIRFKKNVFLNGKSYNTSGGELDISDTQNADQNFGTLEEDIRRRDFTINMLARDLKSGEILDLSGQGLHDLEKGILQGHPQVDIKEAFKKDPLRIIRLFRFAAIFGFKISSKALEAAKALAPLLEQVSSERTREELVKTCKEGKLASFINHCEQAGVLKHFLPEVHKLKGVEQDKRYHSEGDVFTHTLMVVEKSKPEPLAQISALLHDVGKPQTKKIISGERAEERINFPDHEVVGAKLAKEILERLKFDNNFIQKAQKLVLNHLKAGGSKDWNCADIRKFIREMGEELEDVLRLTEIDLQSTYGPDGKPYQNPIPELKQRIEKAQEIPVTKTSVVSGKEIMEEFNLPPGSRIGELLEKALDFEDEQAAKGKRVNKNEALEHLRQEATKQL